MKINIQNYIIYSNKPNFSLWDVLMSGRFLFFNKWPFASFIGRAARHIPSSTWKNVADKNKKRPKYKYI